MSDRPTINSGGVYLHKWVLPILVGLLLVAGAAWTGVLVQARNALPRVEAAETYVSNTDHHDDMALIRARLDRVQHNQERMEDKIDKLLTR